MLTELRGLTSAQKLFLAFCCLLALGSVSVGFVDCLHRSQDFQWSGAHILLSHVDPWLVYLEGNPGKQILSTENPVYLPHYYVMFAPLGLLAERHAAAAWGLLNITFAVTVAILVARFYRLPRWQVLLLVALFLAATPTRNTIGNGQQGLFILLFWSLGLLQPGLPPGRSAVAGISYFKMNFAPATGLYLLLRGGVRAVAWSAIPLIAGDLLVWSWIRGEHSLRTLFSFAVEPLKVAKTGYFPIGESPNLMDVCLNFLTWLHVRADLIDIVGLLAAITITGTVLFLATRPPRSSLQWQMALLGTLSVSMFRHHPYDGVVLIFPFCYALHCIRQRKAKIVLALLSFLWFFLRILDAVRTDFPFEYVANFALLVVILTLTYQLRTPEWTDTQGLQRPGSAA